MNDETVMRMAHEGYTDLQADVDGDLSFSKARWLGSGFLWLAAMGRMIVGKCPPLAQDRASSRFR